MARRSRYEVMADRLLVEDILRSLDTSAAAVEKAIVVLYRAQTQVEQKALKTLVRNGQGFSASDALAGTALARDVVLAGMRAGVPPGQRLVKGALAQARDLAKRYAGTQLLALAKSKLAAEDAARAQAYEDQTDGKMDRSGRGGSRVEPQRQLVLKNVA